MRIFQLFATLLFFTFMGIFAVVVITAYSHSTGATGLKMAKIQEMRDLQKKKQSESEIASP